MDLWTGRVCKSSRLALGLVYYGIKKPRSFFSFSMELLPPAEFAAEVNASIGACGDLLYPPYYDVFLSFFEILVSKVTERMLLLPMGFVHSAQIDGPGILFKIKGTDKMADCRFYIGRDPHGNIAFYITVDALHFQQALFEHAADYILRTCVY